MWLLKRLLHVIALASCNSRESKGTLELFSLLINIIRYLPTLALLNFCIPSIIMFFNTHFQSGHEIEKMRRLFASRNNATQ